MKQNLQFPDGKLAVKSINEVYADSNGNITVDHVATADTIGSTTATQVADTVNKAHTHDNKTTLDKLADASGKLTYNGSEIGGTVDESRLLPTGGKNGNILEYQEGADRGNGNDVRLLLQNAMTDSANGNAAPAAVTTQGVTLTGDNNLLFDGNDSHVTAVLATDEIFAADKEWTIDFWMKPTANSSEWNYILTENRGDWGSHSIGLTWNKSKSVLEQDTGGYVASVIKAPNWPNNSIACAAGEWHFVAVEKQKTATGWSLNYYLNGAIWLRVAFTADFVPFDASDNPFWFGGKTTDSGRWFKGEVNKLRVTMGARYGGKAFAVPDRSVDYEAPSGLPVWIDQVIPEPVDESRLLPENPANGDIPCFDATATVGGGNDANTKALLHFDAEVKDEAAGNAAPLALSSLNATIDTTVSKFGSGSLKLTSGHVFVPIPDLTAVNCVISCWVYLDSLPSSYSPLFCQDDDVAGSWNLAVNNEGIYMFCRGGTTKAKQPLQAKTWYWAAIVKSGKELRFYLNGAYIYSLTDSTLRFTSPIIGIGEQTNEDGRKLTGNIDEFRIQFLTADELSAWTGLTIPVPVEAYSAVQTIGEWGLINKTSLVNSINGITPDDTGNVTLDLLTEEQLSKLNSIVLANDFTFTQSDIVSNMITKNATTLGVPAGSMVQVLSNTGIVMTERAGILVYWSGNNLIIDFTGYFNTTQTTLTGTWTVKFAGNFVGSGSGGSGTVAAIAYPIVLVKPAYTDAVHLEMVYATQDDYSDAQTLVNTKTTSSDRSLVKAFGGTAWETCPSGGFGSVYDKQPVKIIVSSKLDATTIYNIKYRWISASSDTSVSDWYGMVYPCYTVSQ